VWVQERLWGGDWKQISVYEKILDISDLFLSGIGPWPEKGKKVFAQIANHLKEAAFYVQGSPRGGNPKRTSGNSSSVRRRGGPSDEV